MTTLSYDQIKYNLEQRYWNKRRLGVEKDSRSNSPEVDVQSGLAEYFVSKTLGCECNFDVLDGNDGGYDMIYKGYKVDVKWLGWYKDTKETRKSGRIIVDLHKLTSDIYIAVSGCEQEGFKIQGWCWKQDILDQPLWKSNYRDKNGLYERYAIHTSKLRKEI